MEVWESNLMNEHEITSYKNETIFSFNKMESSPSISLTLAMT
jgi:hypothetical protein